MSILVCSKQHFSDEFMLLVCKDRPKTGFTFTAENETTAESESSFSALKRNENETFLPFSAENENKNETMYFQ